MSKFTDTLKAAFGRRGHREVPAKQVHRWEGEGGALHPSEHDDHEPRQPGTGDTPEGGVRPS